MKILEINSVCGIGSTGRIATDLYHVAKARGHECKIAYGRGVARNVPVEDTIRIGSAMDVNLHAALSRIMDRTGSYSKKATRELIRNIKKYNPDVIHLHNLHGYYLNIEILFKYLIKEQKNVIWTLHDCWAFTGHCSHFEYIGCEQWRSGCRICKHKGAYPKSILFSNAKNNFIQKQRLFTSLNNMICVSPSNWLAALAQQSFLNKNNICVIHNGIDLNVFKPTECNFRSRYGLQNKKIVLGVSSVWSAAKGIYDFFTLRKLLDEEYAMVMVGLTQKQMQEVPKGIIGITRTTNEIELAEIYSAADVFVNCTKAEVLGMVNIEALACGTPVITYNSGGSSESITEKCGVITKENTPEEMARCIQELIQFEKADILARASEFDVKKKYNEYIDLMEKQYEKR